MTSRRHLVLSAFAVAALGAASIAVPTGTAAAGRSTPSSSGGAGYVALGDGYSSGEGLAPYEAGTDVAKGAKENTCERSKSHAYPDLPHTIVLPRVKGTRRGFFACAGATVTDIETAPGEDGTPPEYGENAQTSEISSTTGYITLTAGIDDVSFDSLVDACAEAVVHGKVVHLSTTSCSSQLSTSKALLASLETALEGLYSELLASSSPSSELVVAGYPQIFPASFSGVGSVDGAPFCTLDKVSGTGSVGLKVSNAKSVASFEKSLNSTIEAAVSDVNSTEPGRVMYSNVYSRSKPVSCKGASSGSSVAGPTISKKGGGIGPGGVVIPAAFHPTAGGQRVYAKTMEKSFKKFAKLRKSITFVDSPGTGKPPKTLGRHRMRAFPKDTRAEYSDVSTIKGPTGDVSSSTTLEVLKIGKKGWKTWSHGFRGVVYWVDSTSVTLTLPKHTAAFYLYIEPDAFETYDLAVSANNGTSSGDQTVYGKAGAKYFGFYASKGLDITSILISCPDDFAIGELAIAKGK